VILRTALPSCDRPQPRPLRLPLSLLQGGFHLPPALQVPAPRELHDRRHAQAVDIDRNQRARGSAGEVGAAIAALARVEVASGGVETHAAHASRSRLGHEHSLTSQVNPWE